MCGAGKKQAYGTLCGTVNRANCRAGNVIKAVKSVNSTSQTPGTFLSTSKLFSNQSQLDVGFRSIELRCLAYIFVKCAGFFLRVYLSL